MYMYVCMCVHVRVHVCVRVCVCACAHMYDITLLFHTHPVLKVSSLLALQSTARATTPAMAAVSRTPPTKPPMAAPTATLEQPLAVHGREREGKQLAS